jgi:predicted ArsR family transcriptional regulator
MATAELGRRFSESTRGRVVALLRREPRTVDELASELDLTDNAIRSHLAALERDGLVRQEGVRRTPGAGKPALIYELHPAAHPLLSRAYSPVLDAVLEVIVDEVPERAEELMRLVGRRLAAELGVARAQGSPLERARIAADVLTSLGGDVVVTEEGGVHTIRSSGCPLSTTVSRRPEVCKAVETLVSEVTGESARECCQHGGNPKCCFVVGGS